MANSGSVRAYMASHLINLFPSLVRAELLSDNQLLEDLDLATDATVSFGHKDVYFSRSTLFKAIRSAFENIKEEFCVDDISSKTWSLRNHPGERLTFPLTNGYAQILNNSFWPLCGDVDRRLSIFETEAKNRRLSKEELERWRAVLSEAVVRDDNVTDLLLDLDCSPSHIEDLLRREFKGASHNVSILVPNDIRYYERFVGKYCGSKNIEEYCNNELKQYFDGRIEGGMTENDLLLCMHKSISKVVSTRLVDEASYQSVAKRAIETCHPIFVLAQT